MKRSCILFLTGLSLLLGLPLLGVFSAGHPVHRYLEFPPRYLYVHPAPFSWPVFIFYGLIFMAMALPILVLGGRALLCQRDKVHPKGSFPWWGWASLVWNGIFWMIAWTRIPVLSPIQPHTFFPLWASYIVFMNALCLRRDGHCMMIHHPFFFALLFPASAGFWWFFEYLNRFVQNWHYVGVEYGTVEYVGYATLSFSTVLPAVLGTRDWIAGVQWIQQGFHFPWVGIRMTRNTAIFLLLLSGFTLFGIGIWPDILFSVVWVSPLLIIISLRFFHESMTFSSPLLQGEFGRVVSAALAALICGWFWEMWNYYSMAKWLYRIPYVHRFKIFEMPVLGYAGYLPFGMVCGAVGDWVERMVGPSAAK